jgi:proteasome lid subunit RPN8/RPN11
MKKRQIQGIARDALGFILETSRSSMPSEFAGLLQADGEIITEVIILPGTESSRMSALIRLYMLPNMHIVGSAHSHPSSNIRPFCGGYQVLLQDRRLSHNSRPAFR